MRATLALLLLAAAPAAAQGPPAPPSPPARPGAAADTTTAARLRLADSYLRGGRTDQAVVLLEDLLAAAPRSLPVLLKLREAYAAAGRWDGLVALADARIEAEGPRSDLLAERGAALYQAGRLDEAEAAWAGAIALAPDAETTYRTVANAIGEARDYERAAAVLVQGRERLGDSSLYRFELANLYGLAGQAAPAADEYLALLGDAPESAGTIRVRLGRLLARPDGADAIALSVERAVRRDPLQRAYRELASWIALERGDFAAALDANVAIDRLESEEGQSLVAFAEAALAAGAIEEAGRAYALVLERHPSGPMAPLALLGQADLARHAAETAGERALDPGSESGAGLGQPAPAPKLDAARAGYRAFAERYPSHPLAAEALRRAAVLERDHYRDFAAAETLLAEVEARTTEPEALAEIRLDRGRLALAQGDLGAARAQFTRVEEDARIGPAAEIARLELASLDFYQGDFAGALARAEAMNQNTATDAANDAIILKLLLREHQDEDSLSRPLRAYARAALAERQSRLTPALATLDSLLATVPEHPVADEAHFLRARALRAAGRTDDALAALDDFPSQHADSYLVERARFLRAEVLERDRNDLGAARVAYDDFLSRHPGSLLAPEARARLRRLRGDGPPG